MLPISLPRVCQPEFVGRRLHDLGCHLGDVSGRVRLAIADAVRDSVAAMARDAVDRVLSRLGNRLSVPRRYLNARDEYDPWQDPDEDEWSRDREEEDPASVPPSVPAKTATGGRCAVALALGAAGWWLRQQGTLVGALGVALIAAAVAALTGPLAWDGLPLVEAAGELLNLQRCLSAVATLLARA